MGDRTLPRIVPIAILLLRCRLRLASHGRSSITNGHATGNPPPHPQHLGGARDAAANPAFDAHGRMPGKTRSIRSSAIAGAFAVDDVPPSQRPPGGAVAGRRRDSTRRHSSFHTPRAVDTRTSDYQEEEGEGEEVEEEEEEEVLARGSHTRAGRRDSGGPRQRGGQEFERAAAFENGHTARGTGERRRTYNGSGSSSLQADSWDPAVRPRRCLSCMLLFLNICGVKMPRNVRSERLQSFVVRRKLVFVGKRDKDTFCTTVGRWRDRSPCRYYLRVLVGRDNLLA